MNIYISKSNQTNPDSLINVRADFKHVEISIAEFTGGAYSTQPIIDADALIYVNYPSALFATNTYLLGRGGYTEILTALENGKLAFYYNETTGNYYKIENCIEHDKNNWKLKYGLVMIGKLAHKNQAVYNSIKKHIEMKNSNQDNSPEKETDAIDDHFA